MASVTTLLNFPTFPAFEALDIALIGVAITEPTAGIKAIPENTAPYQSFRTALIPTFTPSAVCIDC